MWAIALVGLILLVLNAFWRRTRRPSPGRAVPRPTRTVIVGQDRASKPTSNATFAAEDVMGIDGCRDGWVVATSDLALTRITFTVVKEIRPVLDSAEALGSFVAIDIPIGLPRSGSRACDVAARQALGPDQGSRVFPAPAREALNGISFVECCELNERASSKKISQQTYAIIPKIIEVDEWMTRDRQRRVREMHPEVSFCVLNGAPLLHSKKTKEGQLERMAILRRFGLVFDPLRERQRLSGLRVGVDDIIDAAVALLTALRTSAHRAQLLGDGACDVRGLRMEIVA